MYGKFYTGDSYIVLSVSKSPHVCMGVVVYSLYIDNEEQ